MGFLTVFLSKTSMQRRGSHSSGRALGEAASGLEHLIELATGGVLQDEDDTLFVVEPGEEAEHVGVVDGLLNLDLPP